VGELVDGLDEPGGVAGVEEVGAGELADGLLPAASWLSSRTRWVTAKTPPTVVATAVIVPARPTMTFCGPVSCREKRCQNPGGSGGVSGTGAVSVSIPVTGQR
jgi:hypothetical protein